MSHRDSLIVAIGDAMTCVFGGFVIFSFLGYMAGRLDVDVKDVVKDGECWHCSDRERLSRLFVITTVSVRSLVYLAALACESGNYS